MLLLARWGVLASWLAIIGMNIVSVMEIFKKRKNAKASAKARLDMELGNNLIPLMGNSILAIFFFIWSFFI